MQLSKPFVLLAATLLAANAQVRKEIRDMTQGEFDAYSNAVNLLVANGKWDEFATTHANNFRAGIHNTPQFLPWHRQFLRELELELQSASGDSNVMIPYWDWTDGSPDEIFTEQRFGGYGNYTENWCVTTGPFAGFEPCIQRNTMYYGQTFDLVDVNVAYGSTNGSDHFEVMRFGIEGLHNGVHNGVGGTMGSTRSPYDPIFYSHHCFIEKLWADWQRKKPEYRNAYTNDNLDEPLLVYGTVTVKDVMDYTPFDVYSLRRLDGDSKATKISYSGHKSHMAARGDSGEQVQEILEKLPINTLKQIPRTCQAPLSRAQGNIFWSTATDEAIRISASRVDLTLQDDGDSCLNIASILAASGNPDYMFAPTGTEGSSSTAIIGGAVGAGVVAVGAALLVVKRRSRNTQRLDAPPTAMTAHGQATNPMFNGATPMTSQHL